MRYSTEHGFYELNPFPGCNQLVVSNHAFISPEMRGRGHGAKAHEERLEQIFNVLRYDYALCTVVSTNEAQIHILETHGWKQLDAFHNSETGKNVLIYGRRSGY